MSGNRRKRLERLEQKLGDLVRREELANCNCQTLTFAWSTKTFEAEMNTPCPTHGFRRLGQIMVVSVVPMAGENVGTVDEESLGLDQLVEEYEGRLTQVEEAENEEE
jgi:hypothetical protein